MSNVLPQAVIEELAAIYHKINTVQYAVNHWDRSGAGVILERIAWDLGDLIAEVSPSNDPADIDGAVAFTTATERGQ